MLVITRRENEKLQIGEALVTVLSVRGKIVRLGIEAPKEVDVKRPDATKGVLREER